MAIPRAALQGAFAEHESMLRDLRRVAGRDVRAVQVRTPDDLALCDALIIPGGGAPCPSFRAPHAGAHPAQNRPRSRCSCDCRPSTSPSARLPRVRLCGARAPARSSFRARSSARNAAGRTCSARLTSRSSATGLGASSRASRRRSRWRAKKKGRSMGCSSVRRCVCRAHLECWRAYFHLTLQVVLSAHARDGAAPIEIISGLPRELLPPLTNPTTDVTTADGPALLSASGDPTAPSSLPVPGAGDPAGAAGAIAADDPRRIVALRQGRHMLTTFHPELSGDAWFHEYFVRACVLGA
jgi:hypothetical protein